VARLSAATVLIVREDTRPWIRPLPRLPRTPGTSTRMPGAHRAGDGQRLEVLALHRRGRARLIASTSVARFSAIAWASKLLFAEPTRDDPRLVDLELDTAGLHFLDRALQVEGGSSRPSGWA
jgi:hypothetical protein